MFRCSRYRKSDITIGFSTIDLPGNKNYKFENQKSLARVSSIPDQEWVSWLLGTGFEITTKILSCDRARQNWLSCEIVHESYTTKLVRDKNRARQKSCMTWVLIRKNFRLIVLKYANFTNLDHLESILINFSAFLEKNYYFTSKNAPKIVDPDKKSFTTKFLHRARFLS